METLSQIRRILVVDDDVAAAEVLVELLEIHGHTVKYARDGGAALLEMAAFKPDVILLDLGMPDLDGFQVANELRKKRLCDKVLVVALTGRGDHVSRVQVRDSGFHMHIVKPASIETVLMAVNSPIL